MSISLSSSVRLFEGAYSSVIKNDEMNTTITQEARTGVYTITTQDTERLLCSTRVLSRRRPVTMISP